MRTWFFNSLSEHSLISIFLVFFHPHLFDDSSVIWWSIVHSDNFPQWQYGHCASFGLFRFFIGRHFFLVVKSDRRTDSRHNKW